MFHIQRTGNRCNFKIASRYHTFARANQLPFPRLQSVYGHEYSHSATSSTGPLPLLWLYSAILRTSKQIPRLTASREGQKSAQNDKVADVSLCVSRASGRTVPMSHVKAINETLESLQWRECVTWTLLVWKLHRDICDEQCSNCSKKLRGRTRNRGTEQTQCAGERNLIDPTVEGGSTTFPPPPKKKIDFWPQKDAFL